MRRLARFLAAAAVAGAVLSASAADEAPAELKFAWPVPSRATVTQKSSKRGKSATTRFRLSLERAGGGDLRLHLGEFRFVDFAGRAATDPAVADAVMRATRLANSASADLLIGPDGRIKDVVDLDGVVRTMLADMEENGTDAEKSRLAELREQMRTPQAKDAVRRDAMKPWQTWIGEWIGRAIPAEGESFATHAVRDVDGTEREARARLRRGPPDSAGHVRFVREAVLEGDATKASLAMWIKAVAAKTGTPPPEGHFTGLTLSNRLMTIADPASMRPTLVLHEEACVAHRKNAEDLVLAGERSEYAFEWDGEKPTESGK
jgi:hypothetical protein